MPGDLIMRMRGLPDHGDVYYVGLSEHPYHFEVHLRHAASGGYLRRGESTKGVYKAYKGMVEGYIPGIQG